jgi:TadE-like protein
MRRSRQKAAALVEFQIVLLLGLLPLVLGILQLALLLMAKHVVHYATYQAARSGAVAAADPAAMRRALAIGLMPLHWVSSEPTDVENITSLALSANLRSGVATRLYAQLTILRPSAAAFADFATQQGSERVLRNDSLLQQQVIAGARSQQSVQQANVLQIQVSYCHELIVPLINRALLRLLQTLDDNAWHQVCYAMGRVPLAAEAAINLQSDARFHGDG